MVPVLPLPAFFRVKKRNRGGLQDSEVPQHSHHPLTENCAYPSSVDTKQAAEESSDQASHM